MEKKNASRDPVTKYVLTLSPEQAYVVTRACELFTRLHTGQLNVLSQELMGFCHKDFCERWDAAEPLLLQLRQLYFPDLVLPGASYGVGNHQNLDVERAWDMRQVLRNAIAWHEHPEGGMSVDFRPPLSASGETLATCEVKQSE